MSRCKGRQGDIILRENELMCGRLNLINNSILHFERGR